MAFKGTAGKSSSGASMSKYDVEVEARLKSLEAVAHQKKSSGSNSGDLAQRIDIIEAVLRKVDIVDFDKQSNKERVERGLG
tara:strand:- start:583 stop:825 length:243 start_codon:yes stop_codon:yes gene_type:complete